MESASPWRGSLPRPLTALAFALLAAGALAGCGRNAAGEAAIVAFGPSWSVIAADGMPRFLSPGEDQFVLRRAPDGNLLVAMETPSRLTSLQAFVLPTAGPLLPRPAPFDSFVQGTPVPFHREAVPLLPQAGGLSFQGRTLSRGGQEWGRPGATTRVSPTGRWVALLSITGDEAATESQAMLPEEARGEPYSGTLWVDVHDTGPGQRHLRWSAPFRGTAPSPLFASSGWLDESRFLLPLQAGAERAVIIRMRRE